MKMFLLLLLMASIVAVSYTSAPSQAADNPAAE